MMERLLTIVSNFIRKAIIFGILLLSTISALQLSDYSIAQINFGAGCLFTFFLLNYLFYLKRKNQEYTKAAAVFALTGTVSLVCGSILRDMDQSGLGRNVQIIDIVFGVGIFIILYIMVHNLLVLFEGIRIKEKLVYCISKKGYVLLVIFFVITWLPYYLTFFPGIIGKDPLESIMMGSQGMPWTNHHPILYTAFIKLFLFLFQNSLGINVALGMMTFVQQCILAIVFSYAISFMWKRGITEEVLIGTILFVALNPVIAVFSVYATKDVLFSASILLLILNLYRLQEQNAIQQKIAPEYWTGLFCNAFFVIFLRNNGSFIIIGVCIYLLLQYRKYWKQISSVLAILFLCIIVQKQVLFPVMHVEEGSFAESLSIPLQQVGQAVVDGPRVTDEEKTYLNQLISMERMAEVYAAGYTDPIKFDEAFDDEFLNAHKSEFLKVWFGMLGDNFGSFVKAYLLQTAGYWDISQTESLTIYGVTENELGIEQNDIIQAISGASLQPVIEKLVLVCRKLPILSYLTNMAMMLFYTLLVGYLNWRKGHKNVCLVPLWISWGTIMIAAPASCKFRYMLPVYMALPVLLWIMTTIGLDHEDK